MKNSLSFFLAVSRLKTMKRTGWVWLKRKSPETIAEHSFRTTMFAWILGEKTHLNIRRMIEMALLHDICEVYAGDLTPYYGILPKGKKAQQEALKRWVRLPQKKKELLSQKKFALEKKALLRLVKPLKEKTQQEIYARWLEYEKGLSFEGRFVKQVDKLEAMVQAIEYFGTGSNTPVTGWWEEVEELVDHPVLQEFVHSIEKHFYRKKKASMKREIEFFLALGKLKESALSGWKIRRVKNPDSFANHLFMLSIMGWVFAKERMPGLNKEKVLKMCLIHNICSVYAKDRTPYDPLLMGRKTERERRKILAKWVRYSMKKKQKLFVQQYKEQWKAFHKLTLSLEQKTRNELRSLWKEFKENTTKEARFVNQMYVMELLLQALLYWKRDKKFPVKPWWEWAFEFSDHMLNLQFMDELKHRFVTSSGQRRR